MKGKQRPGRPQSDQKVLVFEANVPRNLVVWGASKQRTASNVLFGGMLKLPNRREVDSCLHTPVPRSDSPP